MKTPPVSAPNNPADAREARAPFRFGVGTLLLITTMYAVLFAMLRAADAPPAVFVAVALLFTAVGLGQKFLFKGQRRGNASIIAGAGFFVGLYVTYRVVFWQQYLNRPLAPFDAFEAAFAGAIYGYLAGLLISGAFLLVGKMKSFLGRRAKQPDHDASSSEDSAALPDRTEN
ncbi:MAG: hypothetical protein ABSG68_26675 [Thermoguttaceae bacterium]|jgi:hypothetical protein